VRRLIGLVVALGAGAVLTVDLFLTWFTVEGEGFEPQSGNAFDFGLAIIGSIAIIFGVVAVVDVVRNPEVRSPWLRLLPVVLIAAGTALLVVQLVVGHEVADGGAVYAQGARRIGVYLGVASAVVALAGSALACCGRALPPGYVPPPPRVDAA
jgi:hypothetical protein